MIRREQLRLKTTFRKLLLLSVTAPAVAAYGPCSSSSGSGGDDSTSEDGGTTDTTTSAEASGDDQSAPDSATADVADAGPVCTPGLGYFNDASLVPDATSDGAAGICQYFVDFNCDPGYMTAPAPNGCTLYLTDCSNICTLDGGGFFDCLYTQDAGCNDGAVDSVPGQPITITCGICTNVGRRPAGLRRSRGNGSSRALATKKSAPWTALGGYFAEAAHLEAASVHAFERLRDELRAHGAPNELVKTAERSIVDEVRHARVTTRFARRFGCEPATVRVRRPRARSLEAIALENAVEGCVRETFGAIVATWQATNATDTAIRAHMRRIANDETRHAALAWSVARWAEARLDARARSRIARARRNAVRDLGRSLATNLPPSSTRVAGLPNAREAKSLFEELSRSVWS
jgi:hypothetical protein